MSQENKENAQAGARPCVFEGESPESRTISSYTSDKNDNCKVLSWISFYLYITVCFIMRKNTKSLKNLISLINAGFLDECENLSLIKQHCKLYSVKKYLVH